MISLAHRLIGVTASDENLTADQEKFGGDVLDAAFSEFQYAQGVSFPWSLEATPQKALMPLAKILAADIAPHYGQAAPSRAASIAMLRTIAFPDDRIEKGVDSDAEYF